MVIPSPINMESVYTNLLRIKKNELPVIAYMDNLTWLDTHRLAHLEIKSGGL